MNQEEILAMEPGRDLNALVAEVIFGYQIYRYMFRDWQMYCPSLHKSAVRLRKYSQTAVAAWQVVEKMEQDGWNWDATGRVGREHVEPFKRFYFKPNKYDPVYPLSSIVRADGVELPEAICKAALLTKAT